MNSDRREGAFTNLETLSIHCREEGFSAGLAGLSRLVHLKELGVFSSKPIFPYIISLSNLTDLSLSGVPNKYLADLFHRLPILKKLWLSADEAGGIDKIDGAMQTLVRLESITLVHSKAITDAGVSDLRNLIVFDLFGGTELTPACLRGLTKLKYLALNVRRADGTQ